MIEAFNHSIYLIFNALQARDWVIGEKANFWVYIIWRGRDFLHQTQGLISVLLPRGRHWLRLVNHILKGEETYADTTNELTLMTSPPFTAGGSALVLNSLSFRT